MLKSPVNFDGDRANVANLNRGNLNNNGVLPVVSLNSKATVLTGNESYDDPYKVDNVEIKSEGTIAATGEGAPS